ncbi:MAG: hypothetical protein ACRDHO_05800 [Actinomycetota bacterium]
MYVASAPPPNSLRASVRFGWRLLTRRPALAALVIGGSVLMFAAALGSGETDLGPGDLAKLFSIPPMSIYAALGLAQNLPMAIILVVANFAIFAGFVGLLTEARPRAAALLRGAGLHLAGTLTVAIFAALGYVYVASRSRAALGEDVGVAPLFLLLIPLLIYPPLTTVLGTMSSRALAGQKATPRLRDGSIWLLVILCVWMNLFLPGRLDAISAEPGGQVIAYALAFGTLTIQMILTAAIVQRSVVSDDSQLTLDAKSS